MPWHWFDQVLNHSQIYMNCKLDNYYPGFVLLYLGLLNAFNGNNSMHCFSL